MQVILVSVDALVTEDLEVLRTLPFTGKLLERASVIERCTPIFPTHTYPCHASIMTGLTASGTGIIKNKNPDGTWAWYRSSIKAPLLTDVLRRNNLKTAAVCWPVLGGADIDYLVPEIWADGPTDDPTKRFRSASSPEGFEYYELYKAELDWMRTPGMDDFAADCFDAIMRDHSPDFAALHLSYLDHQKHGNGAETYKNTGALKFIDGKLETALSHVREDAVIFIMGDHGHRNYSSYVSLPAILKEEGIEGIVTESASYMAYAYGKNCERLKSLAGKYPVECVMTPDEAESRYGLSGSFDAVLTSADGFIFRDMEEMTKGAGAVMSDHGFSNEKGPFPPLVTIGYETEADECRSVDVAPTILSLFDLELKCDGRVIPGHIR